MLGGISRCGETPVYNDEGMPDILEILQTLDPVLVFSLLSCTTAWNYLGRKKTGSQSRLTVSLTG